MVRHHLIPHRPNLRSTSLLLAMILLTALSLRLFHLDWDDGAFLHPDELHVVNTITLNITIDWPPDLDNLFDPSFSHLNPRSIDPDSGRHSNFAYGALPLIVTDLTASTLSKVTGTDWNAFYGHIHLVGRVLSALADTVTVLLIFLIGRSLFSIKAGLLGAALYATAPIPIQLSHFFTTDVWMTCFATLSLYCCVRASQTGLGRWFFLSGAGFGLAMASKASVIMLAAAIVAAGLSDLARRRLDGESRQSGFAGLAEQLLLAAIGAIVAFGLFEPYALLQPGVYLGQIDEQSRIVLGVLDVPFTRQYVGTTPLLYQAEQLFKWGLGPVAAMLFLGGLIVLIRAATFGRNPGALVLTTWLVFQGAVILIPETKFMRYLEPLLPALAVGGGAFTLYAMTQLRRRFGPIPAAAALSVALIGIAFWTTSFLSVYAAPNTRIEASRWIYQHIPGGSRLSAETWDLALPLTFAPGLSTSDRQLEQVPMELYRDREPMRVADDIFSVLSKVDYVVMASNRVSSAMPHSIWRYPVQNRYYELLASGDLGFTLVADFRHDPGIGSIRFNDQSADESFVNYDHPEVLIFRKTTSIDRVTYDALMAPATNQPYRPTREAPEDSIILEAPVGSAPIVSDARWSSVVTSHTFAALAVWIVLLVLLQLVGLPLTWYLFPKFPDMGNGFARLITTLLAAYLVWILSSLELIRFRAVWCWAALILLSFVSVALMRRERLIEKLRARSTAIAGADIAFWSVFVLFLVFRFINPDSWHPLWGGEKPMEFAHLNAILRSAHFPPYDPWFANGYINYYYYGTYLVAFWIKLTGIPSEIAFNLAQPTVIALIASGGYSAVSAISRGFSGRRHSWLGGAIGAVMLVLIGNLDSALLVMHGLPDQIAPSFIDWTWGASRSIFGGITEFPYFTGLYADLHAHVIAWPITILAIGLSYSIAQHAREFASALSQGRSRKSSAAATGARFAVAMIVLGSLFATNAWDVPAYAALIVISIFMATSRLPGLSLRITVTLIAGMATALGSFILFQPFFSHYVTLFGSLESTRSNTSVSEFATHLGALMAIILFGIVSLSCSRIVSFRIFAYGDPAILTLFFGGLIGLDLIGVGSQTAIQTIFVVSTIVLLDAAICNPIWSGDRTLHKAILLTAVGGGSTITLLLAMSGELTLALAAAFALGGAVIWLTGDSLSARFTGALVAAGGAIAAGVEIVFLADDLAGDPVWYRMNTIFKFYNQIWTLFTISAAVLFTMMVRNLLAADPDDLESTEIPCHISDEVDSAPAELVQPNQRAERPYGLSVQRRWSQTGLVVSVLLIGASLCYPLLATIPRLELRFPGHPGIGTLNALDWMRYGSLDGADSKGTISFAGDLDAINWFNNEIEGTPVIAEASIGPYRGNGSRFSIATGLPTIIGWDRHERQQRYADGIDTRWAEVRMLYDSDDPAVKMQILRKYDVQYVIVGEVERYTFIGKVQYASPAGISAFETMTGTDLEIAFQSGTTTVYRVLRPTPSTPES